MVFIELLRHSQCTVNPLNPPYQGDFGNFAKVRVIGKCILISLIHHNRAAGKRSFGVCNDGNLGLARTRSGFFGGNILRRGRWNVKDESTASAMDELLILASFL